MEPLLDRRDDIGCGELPAIIRAALPGRPCVMTKISPEMMTRMTPIVATRFAT